jgi:hypothetical protein
MRVASFPCAERYGYVWGALAKPLFPIPEFEEEAEGFRRIDEFYEPWATSGLRVMENSFDNAHFAFVHRASFGDMGHPEPAKSEVDEFADGFVFRSEVPVVNPAIQKELLHMAEERTVRQMTARWWMPFLRKLRIRYPNGLVHSIVTAATPIDDRTSQICQWVYRNDTEEQAPAEKVIAFDREVTIEDKRVLETTTWDVPLDMAEELHMPSDRPGIEMRRRFAALLAAQKPFLALYIGGMGAREKNFHNEMAIKYGYGDAAKRIQELYLAGRKREAEEAVPDELADEMSLVGPVARIRERFRDWEDAGVTTLLVQSRQPEALRLMAELTGADRGAAARG